jgi:hypothetical protein
MIWETQQFKAQHVRPHQLLGKTAEVLACTLEVPVHAAKKDGQTSTAGTTTTMGKCNATTGTIRFTGKIGASPY